MMLKEENRRQVERSMRTIQVLCSMLALVSLTVIVTWPLAPAWRAVVESLTHGILAVFALQYAVRVAVQHAPWEFVRRRKVEALLAVMVALEFIVGDAMIDLLLAVFPRIRPGTITLAYLAISQITLLAMHGLRALRATHYLSERRLSPGAVLVTSFAALITVGTLLLKSPLATTHGIAWIDALFTATSAVCVTGLITVDTATAFTLHGQGVILALIQVGGLGLMTLTYFFAFFLAGGVTIRNRLALQDMLSEESLSQIGTVLALIVGFTFAVEATGAVVIYFTVVDAGGITHPHFFALFHAVSAFCNAGFSTLTNGLADPRWQGSGIGLGTIMLLVVVGGLGFPVWKNIWQVAWGHVQIRLGWVRRVPPRLTANSRIVITTTAILLVGGAGIFYCTEFLWATGEAPTNRVLVALFHSVTSRTAGFNVTPTNLLTPASAAVMMLLMFVGGSPSSTAGGIKTSTAAVAFLSLRAVLRGQESINVFGRALDRETASRALAVILVAILFTTLVTVALCAFEPELSPADLAFEAVSAVATVGMSRGVTGEIGTGAKVVLVVAMFVGRMGVLATLLAVVPRKTKPGFGLPEAKVIIT